MKRNHRNLRWWKGTWIALFTIITSAVFAQEVTSFTLVNAGTNADIQPLTNGATLDLDALPNALNIRANTNPPTVGSVVFAFEGNANFNTEGAAPYALGGDSNGDYNDLGLTPGTKSLTATPFTGDNGTGTPGSALTITFTVVENGGGGGSNGPDRPTDLQAILGTDYEGGAGNETPGLVIVEAENGFNDTPGGWSLHNGDPSYLEATTNHFGNTNGETVTHTITVNEPGVYRFHMKSDITGGNTTESNDSWFKIDNTSDVHFFCVQGGALTGTAEFEGILGGASSPKTIYYPAGNAMGRPDHGNENPGNSGFFKIYRSGGGGFKWSAQTIDNNGFPVYAYFPNTGTFDVAMSERSEGHKVDRFGLTHLDLIGTGVPQTILDGPATGTGGPDIDAQVVLTFNPPNEGDAFELEHATNPFFADADLSDQPFGQNALGVNGLADNTTHYFRMRTVLDGERSEWSNVAIITLGNPDPGEGAVVVSGEMKKWHGITLSFEGPFHDESDVNPNPFLDYRMQVIFSHPGTGKTYNVPGYFATDGDAANSSATAGNVWRVHFTPDETGDWNYDVSFETGTQIAVDLEMEGVAVDPLDGAEGTFNVSPTDKTGRDFRAKGRLSYVGKHHLQFEETGEFFLKGGADAPENFLAYEDFDNTPNNGNRRKTWAPHAGDYNDGDPTWKGSGGTEIIGALNYLAEEGMNAFSFLTMNINGDDKNVFPYVNDDDFLHFDISKIDQWDIVFAHAQANGLYLHFKTQETENDQLLDGGQLDVERKLYYRMLVARFGYHLALNWNLGEENDIWSELNDPNNNLIKNYASYMKEMDPYDHHIVIHTYPGQQNEVYGPLLGDASVLTGASIQTGWNNVYNSTKTWVTESADANRPWVVANDEQGGANVGVPPYLGYEAPNGEIYNGQTNGGGNVNVDHDDIRKQTLWGNLMAGGAGVEYYFGYQVPQSDLTCQDYRSRDFMWDYTRHALKFFTENVPFQDLVIDEQSDNDKWVMSADEEVYVVYLRDGGTENLQVGNAEYEVKYYDPRIGAFIGQNQTVQGPNLTLEPPQDVNEDWAVLITETGFALADGEELDESPFKVYPNPTNGWVNVTGPMVEQVEVFTPDGRLVERFGGRVNGLNLSHLPEGVYVLRIGSDRGTFVHRLVKQ